MSQQNNNQSRDYLAYGVLFTSCLVLVSLGIGAIVIDRSNTITIFNMVLPVVASWVGTILAFYFGRENFETANRQVREMVERLSPEQRAQARIGTIMRRIDDIVCYTMPPGTDETNVLLNQLAQQFGRSISRLPILRPDGSVKHLIHGSRVDKHLADGGTLQDTLQVFIAKQESMGAEFTLNKGFVVVSDTTPIKDAKGRMEQVPSQDICVTKSGSPADKLIGWVSNVRLAKFLE